MARTLISFSKVAFRPQMTFEFARLGLKNALQEVINPKTPISRYHRTWRVSQPKYKDNFMLGKLGYMSSALETKTYYDEVRNDFIEQSVDSIQGHYSQWVLDLSSQILAFEIKPPNIKYQSFMGAFEGLLDARRDIGLTIEYILQSAKFFEWVNQVDRITKFTAKLRRPNPDFSSRPSNIIKELLDDTDADSAKVEINKDEASGGSLKTETTISELVKYGEDGYSTISASGLKDENLKHFDSKKEMRIESIDIPLPIDVEEIFNRIIAELKKFINERK